MYTRHTHTFLTLLRLSTRNRPLNLSARPLLVQKIDCLDDALSRLASILVLTYLQQNFVTDTVATSCSQIK
jgi:hypothetical protein